MIFSVACRPARSVSKPVNTRTKLEAILAARSEFNEEPITAMPPGPTRAASSGPSTRTHHGISSSIDRLRAASHPISSRELYLAVRYLLGSHLSTPPLSTSLNGATGIQACAELDLVSTWFHCPVYGCRAYLFNESGVTKSM